jgi:hypothetical protein
MVEKQEKSKIDGGHLGFFKMADLKPHFQQFQLVPF